MRSRFWTHRPRSGGYPSWDTADSSAYTMSNTAPRWSTPDATVLSHWFSTLIHGPWGLSQTLDGLGRYPMPWFTTDSGEQHSMESQRESPLRALGLGTIENALLLGRSLVLMSSGDARGACRSVIPFDAKDQGQYRRNSGRTTSVSNW